MREAPLVEKIKKELARRGAWVFKVHGGPQQTAGIPDLIVCYQGRFIGLEVKVPGNKASALQALTLNEIEAAGGTGVVVYSVPEALVALGLE